MGATAVSMVQAHEGLRTKAYLDPVGIPTICYGHTGPEVKLGLTYTVERCNDILLKDIALHRAGVEKCIKAPLTPNQRDAVVSFAFNVGVPKFCKSTMARKLNARDYIGAADEFPKWANARVNGKLVKLPGLIKRRRDERNLFLTLYRPEPQMALSGAVPAILSR
jgi:Phage-related lysozyme (muraminidase)